MTIKKTETGFEFQIKEPCKDCKKPTPMKELEANKKMSYGAYICDKCADKWDERLDSQLQNI